MQKRPAVLVNPPVTLSERYGRLATAGSSLPPFALMWLAASARRAGFDSAIVDAEAEGLTVDETAQRIVDMKPMAVGFTASTLSIDKSAAVARKLKAADPRIPMVIGGPHFNAAPSTTLAKYPEFDMGAIGEAENIWVELLNCMRDQGDVQKVRGMYLRRDGHVFQTAPAPIIEDMDTIPMPAWDLLPDLISHYQPSAMRQHRSPASALVTTRGCFGKCNFCDTSVFGQKVRGFSAERTFEMISFLIEKYGIKYLTFYDDNFAHHKPRLRTLMKLIKQSGYDFTFSVNSRVDVVNPEVLDLLHDSGCWQISWGIESGSQEILDKTAKHVTIEQIRKALKWSHDAGINNKGFFIIGHAGETLSTIQQTIALALELPLDDFQMSFMTPFPGTEIHTNLPNYGVMDENWERMNMWTPVFIPHGLSREELIQWQKIAIRKFYFRPRIIKNYVTSIDSLARLKAFGRGAVTVLKALFTNDDGVGSAKPEDGLFGAGYEVNGRRPPVPGETTICR